MGAKTSIEWTRGPDGKPGSSWNPIRAYRIDAGIRRNGWHCVHASAECSNCYAGAFNMRLGTGLDFIKQNEAKVTLFLDEKILADPLRWKRPRVIFAGSMTDLFGDFVGYGWLDRIFDVVMRTPQHTYIFLTKRADRMYEYISGMERRREFFDCDAALDHAPWPLPNVRVGISAGDQKTLTERVPWLLRTPAAHRIVSLEPMLDRMNLRRIEIYGDGSSMIIDALTGQVTTTHERSATSHTAVGAKLSQVIVGGESGRNARPMHPDWVRDLRDQCAATGVPFFFKQWGEWADTWAAQIDPDLGEGRPYVHVEPLARQRFVNCSAPNLELRRVGKKAAGRLLDGVEHNGVPT